MIASPVRIQIQESDLDVYHALPRRRRNRRPSPLALLMRLGELVLTDRPISDAVSWAIIVLAAGFWVAMLLLGLERGAWRAR